MICTKNIFSIIREEIEEEQGLLVESHIKTSEEHHKFYLECNKPDGERYYITVDMFKDNFKCNCLKSESECVSCQHIISSIKFM